MTNAILDSGVFHSPLIINIPLVCRRTHGMLNFGRLGEGCICYNIALFAIITRTYAISDMHHGRMAKIGYLSVLFSTFDRNWLTEILTQNQYSRSRFQSSMAKHRINENENLV